MMRVHASAVAFGSRGVLIRGASGSGKSSLALQLMHLGATLIADDQTDLYHDNGALWGRAPDTIEGLIEARGVGLLRADTAPSPIILAVDLDQVETQRLPPRRSIKVLDTDLPCLHKVESPAWPAAIAQYLLSGRSEPE